jgi:hypothetical protein
MSSRRSDNLNMSGGTMMKPHAMLSAVVVVLAVCSTPGLSQQTSQAPAREGPTLILAAKLPLTGVSGRIDHFTFDPKRRLTIFSGLGNDTIADSSSPVIPNPSSWKKRGLGFSPTFWVITVWSM